MLDCRQKNNSKGISKKGKKKKYVERSLKKINLPQEQKKKLKTVI